MVPLPSELVAMAISHLDPFDDRQDLVNCMLVSKAWWEIAARRMYRHLELHASQLERLVVGGSRQRRRRTRRIPEFTGELSDRARRALSFVERLYIVDRLSHNGFVALYAAAKGRDEPLFPRVSHLRLHDRIYRGGMRELALPDIPQPPKDAIIFDSPRVCTYGTGTYRQFLWLPMRKTTTVTCHELWPAILQDTYSAEWTSFSIFEDRYIEGNGAWWLPDIDARLQDHSPGRPPVNFYVSDPEGEVQAKLTRELAEDEDKDWTPATSSMLRVEFFDDKHPAPPCNVCGKTWTKETLYDNPALKLGHDYPPRRLA